MIACHAVQLRENAIKAKQRAERAKDAADSQLEELTSQRPDDPDQTNSTLQDSLAEIADKDRQLRELQRQVTALVALNRSKLLTDHLFQGLALQTVMREARSWRLNQTNVVSVCLQMHGQIKNVTECTNDRMLDWTECSIEQTNE